jgi:dCTP deaminase
LQPWYKNFGLAIEPFVPEKRQACGMSYGLSSAGYDIRIGKINRSQYDSEDKRDASYSTAQSWHIKPGEFVLLSSLERVKIPVDLICFVHDKSTLARQGLALQNTVLEPGWEGHITLELSNHGPKSVRILVGQPIAQLIFHVLDVPTGRPYDGKYQNQADEPIHAIMEDGVADHE